MRQSAVINHTGSDLAQTSVELSVRRFLRVDTGHLGVDLLVCSGDQVAARRAR